MWSHLATILLSYICQGCTQGLAFATIPLELGKNAKATDADQGIFSIVGYPFSFKFLVAPLVDAFYWPQVGRRESWLIPLQAVNAVLLGMLAMSVAGWLQAAPPAVVPLAATIFVLTAATAVQDVATDAYAADQLSDGRASTCQAVGLTIGFQASYSIYFALSGRGLLDLPMMLQLLAIANFALLGLLWLRQGVVAPDGACEEHMGPHGVARFGLNLVRETSNVRWWILFSLFLPTMNAHGNLLQLRYQKLGFTPELFAEYDLYILPIDFAASWLTGCFAATTRPLSILFVACLFLSCVNGMTLLHFWKSRNTIDAIEDSFLRWTYVALSQITSLIDTVCFVLKFAFITRIAARNQATTATVQTFLNSMANLGNSMAGTWAPFVVGLVGHRLGGQASFDVIATTCIAVGFVGLILFYQKLQVVENFEGWAAAPEEAIVAPAAPGPEGAPAAASAVAPPVTPVAATHQQHQHLQHQQHQQDQQQLRRRHQQQWQQPPL